MSSRLTSCKRLTTREGKDQIEGLLTIKTSLSLKKKVLNVLATDDIAISHFLIDFYILYKVKLLKV